MMSLRGSWRLHTACLLRRQQAGVLQHLGIERCLGRCPDNRSPNLANMPARLQMTADRCDPLWALACPSSEPGAAFAHQPRSRVGQALEAAAIFEYRPV